MRRRGRELNYQKSMTDPVGFESDKEDIKGDNDDGHKAKGNSDEGDGKSSGENEEEDGNGKYDESEGEDNGEMGDERLGKSHDRPTRKLRRRRPSFNLSYFLSDAVFPESGGG